MTVVFFVFHPWSLILTQTPTVIGIGGGGEGGGRGLEGDDYRRDERSKYICYRRFEVNYINFINFNFDFIN